MPSHGGGWHPGFGLEDPEVASYLTYKGFGMPSHGGGWHPGSD